MDQAALEREIRRLRRINAVSLCGLGLVAVAAFTSGPRYARFDVIDVGRVNIVEPTGVIRLAISNRAQFPDEELVKHAGQWVAFSPDGSRLLDSDPQLARLRGRLAQSGADGCRFTGNRRNALGNSPVDYCAAVSAQDQGGAGEKEGLHL